MFISLQSITSIHIHNTSRKIRILPLVCLFDASIDPRYRAQADFSVVTPATNLHQNLQLPPSTKTKLDNTLRRNLSFSGESDVLKRKKKGDVYTFGWNLQNQLGIGTSGGQSKKPVNAVGLKKKYVIVASAHNFGIAITSGGEPASWGAGESGQLGHSDKNSCNSPKKIAALKKNVTIIATGSEHAVAVKEKNVYVWGSGANGKLGLGDVADVVSPVPIPFFKGKRVLNISCGTAHTACIADGQVFTWGKGENGRLGHGSEADQLSPKLVEGLEGKNPRDISCGSEWTSVLMESGDVFSFGYGANGRLGVGTDSNQLAPVLVEALSGKNVVLISCGHDHSLALLDSGSVVAWGYGGNGRLGLGSERDEKKPKEIKALEGKVITAVVAGGYHSAALTAQGEILTWGWNQYGQLGYETTSENQMEPKMVEEFKNRRVVAAACGECHTVVIVEL